MTVEVLKAQVSGLVQAAGLTDRVKITDGKQVIADVRLEVAVEFSPEVKNTLVLGAGRASN